MPYLIIEYSMKKIKLLWSVAFAFAIVLFYATLTSLFVKPFDEWYINLAKPDGTPSSTIISIGWAINYLLSIVLLTRIIYRHDELLSALLLILVGILEVIWGGVFFGARSLLGGVIVQIILIAVSLIALVVLSKKDYNSFLLFIPVIAWYVYTAYTGIRLLFFNV